MPGALKEQMVKICVNLYIGGIAIPDRVTQPNGLKGEMISRWYNGLLINSGLLILQVYDRVTKPWVTKLIRYIPFSLPMDGNKSQDFSLMILGGSSRRVYPHYTLINITIISHDYPI